MDDLISRQAVLEMAYDMSEIDGEHFTEPHMVVDVADIQKLKPQERTGHWIFDEILDKHYYCSECKSMGVTYWDYCPYCGTKMIEPNMSENPTGLESEG